LYAARALEGKNVDVLLIDRQNFHTFTPLLYQVATCGLEAEEIAYPVRGIFRGMNNIRFLLGEVTSIDYNGKLVHVKTNGITRFESYDYLIIAAGSVTSYFGSDDLQHNSFALKSLNDAINLRHHILRNFEKAAWTDDAAYRDALTTLMVVGGGPTGLETAGALYELYNHVLSNEYGKLSARVILVEASDHLLSPYPQNLRTAALKQLESLGVTVMLNERIVEIAPDHVRLSSGRVIPTHTVVWSAGVEASPLAKMLNVPLERAARVPVKPTLEVIGRDNIFVVGDIAHLLEPTGEPYPMLIPVATQQGILVGKNILRRITGETEKTFKYNDRGIMATIGRSRAVAWIFYKIQLTGYLAWLAWLFLHLIMLMGFRNRLNVFINWVWNYFVFPLPGAYSSRMILTAQADPHPESEHQHQNGGVSAAEWSPISASEGRSQSQAE
jgi:NADH dehydrogenase